MITDRSRLDTDNRFLCFFRGWVGMDPQTGAYLYRSSGRRSSGRAARYYLAHPSDIDKTIRFTAFTDGEAIEKANKELSHEQSE